MRMSKELQRGVKYMNEHILGRAQLTRDVKALTRTISEKHETDNPEEGELEQMSNSWERKLCGKCNGHGKIDGEPCPECGGTGLAEIRDERIYPKRANESSRRFSRKA